MPFSPPSISSWGRRSTAAEFESSRASALCGNESHRARKCAPACLVQGVSLRKKPRRVRARRRESSSDPFSPATCASGKTPLRLQVWGLSAFGGQTLRAADCIFLLEKAAKPLFRQFPAPAPAFGKTSQSPRPPAGRGVLNRCGCTAPGSWPGAFSGPQRSRACAGGPGGWRRGGTGPSSGRRTSRTTGRVPW